MNESHNYYKNKLKFKNWYYEDIYIDDGHEKIPRYLAIRTLCIEGLLPFIKNEKYFFKYSDRYIINNIIIILYDKYLNKKYNIHGYHEQNGYDPAHLDSYYNIFDSEKCLSFWDSGWSLIQDFNENNYAYYFRYEIFKYLWYFIDLDNSPISITLNAELQERDEMDEYNESLNNTYSKKYDLY
jgi:hypothetical protein